MRGSNNELDPSTSEEGWDDDTVEDSFTQGYEDDEDYIECAECGLTLDNEKKVIRRRVEEEDYAFCSSDCAEDFEDGMR